MWTRCIFLLYLFGVLLADQGCGPVKGVSLVAVSLHYSAFLVGAAYVYFPLVAASVHKSPKSAEVSLREGAVAYEQLQREASDGLLGKGRSCWQQVQQMLHLLQQQTHQDACSSQGEPFRELIALTRVRCIYSRSNRRFPSPDEGCFVAPNEVPSDWIRDAYRGRYFPRFEIGVRRH